MSYTYAGHPGWEDPFDVLEVGEDASQQEVESSFRKKALKCHPDRHPNDPTARAKFDKLSRAKETLLDPAQREVALHRRRYGVDPGSGQVEQRKGPAPGEWMEGRGFRARAPDERRRAEQERINKADEDNYKRYQEQRRAQAQQFLKESTGGTLGGGGKSLEEARQAFAERLERESDPKEKRRQRVEEDKRKRDAERQAREAEEKKRLEEWREREKVRMGKTRDINEAKAARWQNWDDGTTHGPGTSVSSSNPMVGAWLYGKKPNQYRIVERPDGSLCFDGPTPTGNGRLRGPLTLRGDWHQAEIAFADGEFFGSMRFLFVSSDGEEGLISQCRKVGSDDWGREVFANRAEPRPVPGVGEEIWASPDATSDCSADNDAAPAETAAPAEPVADLNICLTVDSALGLSMDVAVPAGGTVLQLKQRLADEDPTGGTELDSFSLALPGVAESLPDSTVLGAEHTQLEVRRAEEAPPPDSDLLAWLKTVRLESFHEAFVSNGVEQLEDLRSMEQGQVEELAGLIGMKLGHAVRFRKAVKELAAAPA